MLEPVPELGNELSGADDNTGESEWRKYPLVAFAITASELRYPENLIAQPPFGKASFLGCLDAVE
jgi:hypothetical protein